MKYTLGKIKFKDKKGGDIIPEFYSESDGIPSDLLITNGHITLHSSYKYAMIVAFYDRYYIVEYKDKNNESMRLGFLEDVLEPYEELQAYTGKFKIGDKVKVIRKAESQEGNWETCWTDPMTKIIGKTFIIDNIDSTNNYGYRNKVLKCYFPEFVLEKVETSSNLELARNKYKEGMVIRSAYYYDDYTINSKPFKEIDGCIYANNGSSTLYIYGEWAEIISKPVNINSTEADNSNKIIFLPDIPSRRTIKPLNLES